jgi:hypothetical protein
VQGARRREMKVNLKPEIIKGLIDNSGFNEEEVAKKTKIPLESLKEGKLTIPQIKRLAKFLKLPIVAFFSDEIPSLPEVHYTFDIEDE